MLLKEPIKNIIQLNFKNVYIIVILYIYAY